MNKETDPHKLQLCIMLARGDHMAGALLHVINYWSQYSKAKIPGVDGVWRAKERTWWMREGQLSTRQYDRSIAKLAVDGLIEKRQYPFAGRTILHVRPTSKTKSFLAAATTWNAALEVLAQMGFPSPAWHTDKATQITPSLQEMIEAWGEPSLKPEEVGELATFRQGMTSVVGHEGEYDFSAFTLEVIAWTVENWAEFGTGCKGKKICPNPKIEFFCQNFAIALTLFFKAKGVEPSTPDVPFPEPPSFKEPWLEPGFAGFG